MFVAFPISKWSKVTWTPEPEMRAKGSNLLQNINQTLGDLHRRLLLQSFRTLGGGSRGRTTTTETMAVFDVLSQAIPAFVGLAAPFDRAAIPAFHRGNRIMDVVGSDHKGLRMLVRAMAAKGPLRRKCFATYSATKFHVVVIMSLKDDWEVETNYSLAASPFLYVE